MYIDIDYHVTHKPSAGQADLEWTMVNVNTPEQKGDAHVISTAANRNVLIDAGPAGAAEEALLPLVRQRGISAFDLVFISHAHKDHYGGLDVLLDNGIGINEIYFDLPDRSTCREEIPWGCDYMDILRIHRKLNRRGIIIRSASAGQIFQLGNGISLDILYAFDAQTAPVAGADINDLSLIMKVRHRKYSFLFTGDLNQKIGDYLAVSGEDLDADVLKVPHHAVEDLAPNAFFEKVDPCCALISTPQNLWESDGSHRAKSWFRAHDVPMYVSGISGNVTVVVEGDSLTVHEDADPVGRSMTPRLVRV